MLRRTSQRVSIFLLGHPFCAVATVLTNCKACISPGSFCCSCFFCFFFFSLASSACELRLRNATSAHMSAAGWSREGLGGGCLSTLSSTSCAPLRTFGRWSMARARSPPTAPRGLLGDCGCAHACESWAINSDSRHPMLARSNGASASAWVKAGARLARI